MGEHDTDLTEQERTVLEAVRTGFPVSWAPYCDIGDSIGQPGSMCSMPC